MSAAADSVRKFFERLAKLPAGSLVPETSGHFLERVQTVLQERDAAHELLQSLHQRLMDGRNSVGRPTLESWAEEIDDLLTKAEES